jgi:hypothetical protein
MTQIAKQAIPLNVLLKYISITKRLCLSCPLLIKIAQGTGKHF